MRAGSRVRSAVVRSLVVRLPEGGLPPIAVRAVTTESPAGGQESGGRMQEVWRRAKSAGEDGPYG